MLAAASLQHLKAVRLVLVCSPASKENLCEHPPHGSAVETAAAACWIGWLLMASAAMLETGLCRADGNRAVISSGPLRLELDEHDGRLWRLMDAGTGIEIRWTAPPMELGYGSWSCSSGINRPCCILLWPAPSIGRSSRAAHRGWSHLERFQSARTSPCKVEVAIQIDSEAAAEPLGDRRGETDRCRDQQVRFPRVCGLKGGKNQRLAVPAWLGEQAADSRSLFFDAKGQSRRLSWSYPGHLSMQCLACYDDQHGLYAACNDTQALRKTFAMWGTADRQIHFETIHLPAEPRQGGETLLAPLPSGAGRLFRAIG